MSFNNNNLITWTELAPSLQELFKFNQSQIFVERDNRIKRDEMLEDDLNSLSFDREKYGIEIESLISLVATKSEDPRIAEILNRSATQDGQLIKLNTTNSVLFADDGYRNCCIVENDQELQQMKATFTPLDIQDIFNTWYRFAHYSRSSRQVINGYGPEIDGFRAPGDEWQNTGYGGVYTTYWKYNASNKRLENPIDYSPYMGFISPKDFYTNYYIRLVFTSSDNDFVTIICGYMKDAAGKEHTLSFVRSTGEGDIYITWALIYDMDCNTQHIIKNFTHVVPKTFGGTCYFSCKRTNYTLEGKTGPPNSSVDNEAYTIRWTYPDTKPVDMTQAEYDNIGIMLTETNRVGVGAANMSVSFGIADQYCIFEEQDIYALHTDDVWSYKQGTGWYVSGKIKNKIPDRTFMYNPLLKKFVYRKEEKSWTRIRTKD